MIIVRSVLFCTIIAFGNEMGRRGGLENKATRGKRDVTVRNRSNTYLSNSRNQGDKFQENNLTLVRKNIRIL
jgi:hypothetical protein